MAISSPVQDGASSHPIRANGVCQGFLGSIGLIYSFCCRLWKDFLLRTKKVSELSLEKGFVANLLRRLKKAGRLQRKISGRNLSDPLGQNECSGKKFGHFRPCRKIPYLLTGTIKLIIYKNKSKPKAITTMPATNP